jgi:hypothetical protein
VTIVGGGFDPIPQTYVVQISDGIMSQNISVFSSNMTGSSLVTQFVNLRFIPNALCTVRVMQGGRELNTASSAVLTFSFQSSWQDYAAESGLRAGTAAGGQRLTIFGIGFVVNASTNATGDYSCLFSDRAGNSLQSDPVAPL